MMKKQLLAMMLMASSAIAVKAQNPYPLLPIDTVQFVNQTRLSTTGNTFPDWISPTFKDPVYRDTVKFEGVVVTNPLIYGLSKNRKAAYIQRVGGGPWSGVLVMCDPSGSGTDLATLKTETKFYDNFIPGKLVRVTGVIRDFQGETQINLIRNRDTIINSVELLSLDDSAIVYNEIPANELMTGNPVTGWVQQKQTAERWEGTPVIIRNVTVYSSSSFSGGNRSNWNVIDDFGNVLDVRDMSAYYRRDDNGDSATLNVINSNRFNPPPIGTRLEYIKGIVTEYSVSGVQRYGIAPVYPSDVKICATCPPGIKFIERSPIAAKNTDTLRFTAEINTIDTTLKSAKLFYRIPGKSTLDSVVMFAHPTNMNQYVGTINPIDSLGTLRFWFKSEDNKGRTSFFPDPFSLGRSMLVTANGVDNIRVLQFSNTNSGSSIWDGDSIPSMSVKGIVTTSDPLGNYITVQDGQGPNSAILVSRTADFGTDTLLAGDSIEITSAKVVENFNVTTLFSPQVTLLGRGAALPEFELNLPLDSFINNRFAYARPYECVLVKFDSVEVVSTNPDGPTSDFGEFSVYKQNQVATLGLRVDDLSANFKGLNRQVKVGIKMSYIQGPMYFANGNFKLIPRNFTDADLSNVDLEAPVITLLGNNPDSVIVHNAYTDPGATALDNIDGDITDSITVTGTVDTATIGAYVLTYSVKDAWGNESVKTRTVIVYDTLANGINRTDLANAQINVFPNPATNQVNVTVNGVQSWPLNVHVYDVVGRNLISTTLTNNQTALSLNTAELNNGIYFVVVKNNQGSKTIRLVINGK